MCCISNNDNDNRNLAGAERLGSTDYCMNF